jgi:hypothetical protein
MNAHSRSTWSALTSSARSSAPSVGSSGPLVSSAADDSGVAGPEHFVGAGRDRARQSDQLLKAVGEPLIRGAQSVHQLVDDGSAPVGIAPVGKEPANRLCHMTSENLRCVCGLDCSESRLELIDRSERPLQPNRA